MAVTIHELAEHRGIQESEPGSGRYSGEEYARVGLAIVGGCERCHATIAAYNAYPTKSGYWRCADCLDGLGYPTASEANAAIFDGIMP